MSKPKREKPPFMSMRWLNLHLKFFIWSIVSLFLFSCFFMYSCSSSAARRYEERQRKADEDEKAEAKKLIVNKELPANLKQIENNAVAYVSYPANSASPSVIDVKSLYSRMTSSRGFKLMNSYGEEYRGMFWESIKESSLNDLINLKLYELYAQANNLKIDFDSSKEISAIKNNVGIAKFAEALNESNQTEEEFAKELYERKLMNVIAGSVLKPVTNNNALTEESIKAYYEKNKNSFSLDDKISFRQLLIMSEDFKEKANVDEAQIKEYFEANKSDYKSDKQFKVSQILIEYSKDSFKNTIDIKDSDITKLYEERKADYVIGEQVKARHILIRPVDNEADPYPVAKAKIEELKKRIDAGEDFAKIAKEASDDSSASNGGELGTFGRGVMVKPFEEAAFQANIGKVTEPVKTQFGYHLIKVEDKIPASERSFEEVKTELKEELRSTKALEVARHQLDDAYANILSNQKKISDYIALSTAEGSKKNGGDLPIFYSGIVDENYKDEDAQILKSEVCDSTGRVYPQIIKALSSLKAGDVSSVIETPKGLHLFYLKEVLDPKPLTALSKTIRDDIREKLVNKEADKLAKEKAEEIAKGLSGKSLIQIAKEYNSELKESDITFDNIPFTKNYGVMSEMLSAGFGKFTDNGRVYLPEFHKNLLELVSDKQYKDKIVGPFETKFGWNFLEVTNYENDRYEPYEKVKDTVRHIMTLAPNEEELNKLYNEQLDSYKKPAVRKVRVINTKTKRDAEDALKRINDGEIFAMVAQSFSDKINGLNPGSIVSLSKEQLSEKTANAIWALEKGKNTDIIEENGSYSLYRYEGEEQKESVQPLSDVINKLTSELENKYRDEAATAFNKSLFKNAYINRIDQTLKEIK